MPNRGQLLNFELIAVLGSKQEDNRAFNATWERLRSIIKSKELTRRRTSLCANTVNPSHSAWDFYAYQTLKKHIASNVCVVNTYNLMTIRQQLI